jgi:hypothetical protein
MAEKKLRLLRQSLPAMLDLPNITVFNNLNTSHKTLTVAVKQNYNNIYHVPLSQLKENNNR